MMNVIKQKYLAMNTPARRAFWMGIVFTALILTFTGIVFPELKTAQSFQHITSILTPLVIGILILIGAFLIFAGRVKLGGQIIIYATFVGLVIVSLVAEGYGPTIAAVVIVVTSVVATQTQPEKRSQGFIWASVVIAALILVIDFFWPLYRLGINPENVVLARIFALIFALIFGGMVVSQFSNMPLITKLVVVTLTLTIIPMAVVGYASTISAQDALVENANQSLFSSASQVAAGLDSFVLNNLDALRTEAQIGDFIELLEMPAEQRATSRALASANDLLAAFKQRNPVFITSYAILDRAGVAVVDTSVEEIGLVKEARDYFRQPRDIGLPYVSEVRVSPDTGNMSLYFSAPIRNKVGDFLGVLRVRYDARILQQLVLNQMSSTTQNALSMVVSDENILLAHTDDPQLIARAIMPLTENQIATMQQELVVPSTSENPSFVDLPELAEYIAADKLGTGFSGVFQESRTYVLANREQANAIRMKTLPWTVVVAQHESILLAPVAQMERGNMLTGIIAAVLSVIVGGAVARYLAQPLIKLTDVAQQVAAGDLSVRAEVTTHDEIGTLASAFNYMAAQVNSLITGLEQRVADRTKALATSAEVSRRLSTILDQDLLVNEVVEQLQRAFNYYHVHIYLVDESSANLFMAGGTGDAGKEMLARDHKIERGRGLVGRAAETGVPVLVPDVSRAEGWLPNPLLPETKSELAVPIIIGDTVLGVLDVQQNRVEGLKQEDADLLQSIANQVAVGLQNARAYAETQRRANREAAISTINQRIQHTSSPEEALRVAVREIGRMLGTESTVRLNIRPEQIEPENGTGDGSNIGRAN